MRRESGRVLVVDDEGPMRRALEINLSTRGFEVLLAPTGEDALRMAAADHPDVVLLDLGLPGISGLDVIDGLRGWSKVPIIVVSAREAESEKVRALDAGADDYVTKPFGLEELVARIRAAIRRSESPDTARIVTAAFTLEFKSRSATRHGEAVRLTPTEWRLAEALTQRPRSLVTTAELLGQVWGPHSLRQTHYLRVYFGHLRRKLEGDPAHPKHFITVPGEGYRFDP